MESMEQVEQNSAWKAWNRWNRAEHGTEQSMEQKEHGTGRKHGTEHKHGTERAWPKAWPRHGRAMDHDSIIIIIIFTFKK